MSFIEAWGYIGLCVVQVPLECGGLEVEGCLVESLRMWTAGGIGEWRVGIGVVFVFLKINIG